MSIAQIYQFARAARVTADLPPEEQYNTSLYFIYGNHYSIDEFVALFPYTMVGRASKISGWQWHINEKGLPNLRLAYDRLDGTTLPTDRYLLPGDVLPPDDRYPNGIEAWGYIVSIEKEYDPLVHEYFNNQGKQRIHHLYEDKLEITDLDTGEDLEVEISEQLVVYIDLVNTRDMDPSTPFLTTNEERLKWKYGLIELEECGVPGWYVDDICDRLIQKPVQVEPIYIARDSDLTNRVKQRIWEEDDAEISEEISMKQNQAMLASGWGGGELPGGAWSDEEEALPVGNALIDGEETLPADGKSATAAGVGKVASSGGEDAGPEVEGDTIAARLRGRTRSSRPQA